MPESSVVRLATQLLREASLDPGTVTVEPLDDAGATNQKFLVTVAGEKFVLRKYGWPYGAAEDFDRAHKEQWLHEALGALGVPVAPIRAAIASGEVADRGAVLMDYREGRRLGELAAAGTPGLVQAWREAGRALRRAHDGLEPPGGAGLIVGTSVREFDGGWPAWHEANLAHHIERLTPRLDRPLPRRRLTELARAMAAVLGRRPLRVIHNDPHPWNILVAPDGDEWRLAAWLDWEFAWVADPVWDMARLDLFRPRAIGATPGAFYDGYGTERIQPAYDFYRLAITLWMANQHRDGDTVLGHTYVVAEQYLHDLDRHIAVIEAMLSD